MPRKKQVRKPRAALNSDQVIELSHFSSPGFVDAVAFDPTMPERLRSIFESPFTRRAGWMRHREELLAESPAGRRPGGFWWYESPERPREGESQTDCLRRLGLLQAWEVAELAAIESIKQGGDE
jgi:hypothetical protein